MTTTLEKAARAIKLELYEQEDKARRARKRTSIDTHALARVALEAIREPNDGPVEVVEIGVGWDYTQNGIRGVFARMIDAILNEETT
jgi:hypothetical protein